jgi:hypothetical protein
MKPDTAVSVSFLQKWNPDGPWVLTAIALDRTVETRTFYPKDETALTKWLNASNGQRNLYFHVNSCIRDMKRKASREDIKSLDWLHIDIDPRPGHDLNDERNRCIGLLTNKLPKGIPEPTCIVFSGGGYQGFWRLKNPVDVDGNLEKAEDAKLYNLQLEAAFDGDHCHNIDRIMRLPGTINIPNEKKAAAGRVRELASLIRFNDNSYDITAFKKMPKMQDGGGTFGSGDASSVKLEGEIPEVNDVSYLDKWSVSDRVKLVIMEGHHPEEPKRGDNSRSAWVFDCVCNLLRFKVPVEVVFAILMNPEFGINDSVKNAKPSPEKYALRQIGRATEYIIDPKLADLNGRHAVIGNVGGSCRVVEEVPDEALNRSRLTMSTFSDFRNRYMNLKIEIGKDENGVPKYMELGKWWLMHEQRRQYRQIVFRPGIETPEDYNLWKGFSVAAKPGNWDIFRDHLFRNVCGSNPVNYEYLIGWMARTVQEPDSPGEVAVVLQSGKGTGKSKVATTFGRLFGRHMLHISNSAHLVGNFNAHLRDCLVLFADEAFFAGDRKHEGVLKTLITEKTIAIESKGIDIQIQPNYIHLIMASNSEWVVPVSKDERRYFVLHVADTNKQDTKFFAAMDNQMDAGGLEGMLYDLLNHDISSYNVRNVPQTDALLEQKRRSMSIVEEWWYRTLHEGRLLNRHNSWETAVPTKDIYLAFTEYLDQWKISFRNLNETIFGKDLSAITSVKRIQKMMSIEETNYHGDTEIIKRRMYVYQFDDLDGCKRQWDAAYGVEDWGRLDQEAPVAGSVACPF